MTGVLEGVASPLLGVGSAFRLGYFPALPVGMSIVDLGLCKRNNESTKRV